MGVNFFRVHAYFCAAAWPPPGGAGKRGVLIDDLAAAATPLPLFTGLSVRWIGSEGYWMEQQEIALLHVPVFGPAL